ncbi:glycoside hydrolase family 16 protein [Polychaeton citri CBS 116435]|uniref:Glycoside hydrolase family 16 protein n=1 Tax=Polychaeton citri CBS 116435 TaxID=1314669 RepID=A0A9P4Q7J6_9PEZI|nr:glycoside hydrolase family 16 protein [Polychaeton citri CBS 116435]
MDHFQAQTPAVTTAANTPRPGTPDSDGISPTPIRPQNPFASPYGSMPASAIGSTTGFQSVAPQQARYFHSRRIKKGEAERPWMTQKKSAKERWVTWIPIIGIVIGLAVTGFLIYDGLSSVHNHVYCPVLDEDWSGGIDSKFWTKEVEVGGYGNGQFEETTNTDENAFVQDGMLHIKPTLQDAKLIETDNIMNLTKDGTCTSDVWSNCVAVTNTTNGTIVNPVKSARLSTRLGANIKYGRVEVVAKLPAGDWLWPAIWMMPKDDTYGAWPASGEIDIMESRGNNYTYPQGGNNIISSTLHWGPDPANDAWWQNNNKRQALHTSYSSGFHTFGLEWNEKYIFTYVDSRLAQVLYLNFNKPMWSRVDWPVSNENGTRYVDPWSQTGDLATPFDQDFYLILNVAVGGTNGWFEDGVASKPWVDASATAKKDFWNARNSWLPTWEEKGEMIVKSVKIWQQQGYNGC